MGEMADTLGAYESVHPKYIRHTRTFLESLRENLDTDMMDTQLCTINVHFLKV